MTLTHAALALMSLASLACATGSFPRPADPDDLAAAVGGVVRRSRDLHRQGKTAEARRSLEAARALAGSDQAALDHVVSLDATYAIHGGDLAAAVRMLEGQAALAEREARYPMAVNLYDEVLFVRQAQGDAAGMVAAADGMARVTDAARLPPAEDKQWRLGVLWQRAHTYRVLAQTQTGAARAASLAVASEARASFTALAHELDRSIASIAVLDETFAALDGDGPTAVAAARTLELDDLDPQDVYLTARAFEAGGEAAAAEQAKKVLREMTYPSVMQAAYQHLVR
jgi:hypothetical protein